MSDSFEQAAQAAIDQISYIDMSAQITPVNHFECTSAITISATNVMEGDFEISGPPTFVDEYPAMKDALIWDTQSGINFGSSSEMLLGEDEQGHYRAYLSFPIPTLPPWAKLKKVELKLFNMSTIETGDVSIRILPSTFEEKGIAWDNAVKAETCPEYMKVKWAPTIGYQSIDTPDLLSRFANNKSIDFVLMADPSYNHLMHLGTKEHPSPRVAKICVTYIDPRIYNPGLLNRQAHIVARRCSSLERNTHITVNSKFMCSDRSVQITVPSYAKQLEREVHIIAARGVICDMFAKIQVPSYFDTLDMQSSIYVRAVSTCDRACRLIVPSYTEYMYKDTKVTVPTHDNALSREVHIKVRAAMSLEKPVKLSTCPTYNIYRDARVTVVKYNSRRDRLAFIKVPSHEDGLSRTAKIFVIGHGRVDKMVKLMWQPGHNIMKPVQITVPGYTDSLSRDTTIIVPPHGDVERLVSITVPELSGQVEREGTLTVNALGQAERTTQLQVPLYAWHQDRDAQLFAVSRLQCDREVTIRIRAIASIEKEVRIAVPHEAYCEKGVIITPRVRRICDREVRITIGAAPDLGYAFIL